MALDLNDIAADTKTVTVRFGSGSAEVTYRPAAVTTEAVQGISTTDVDALGTFLIDLIASWDIKQGGRKVPITAGGIKKVPLPLLAAIVRAIVLDASTPGEA